MKLKELEKRAGEADEIHWLAEDEYHCLGIGCDEVYVAENWLDPRCPACGSRDNEG